MRFYSEKNSDMIKKYISWMIGVFNLVLGLIVCSVNIHAKISSNSAIDLSDFSSKSNYDLLLDGLTSVTPAKTDTLKDFNFGDVELLPGMVKDEFLATKDYFLNISSEDMLVIYRDAAGLPNENGGVELGGWYRDLQGLTLQQWISAFARMYAVTGDEACKDKAVYLADEFYKCFKTGNLFNKLLWPDSHAPVDKWMEAFMDLYLYCGKQDALDMMYDLVYWFSNNYNKLEDRLFGVGEWYTFSEQAYKAYLLTGNSFYYIFGKRWEYTEYWDLFAYALDPLSKKPEGGFNPEWCHAYSHVNSFNSAAEAYRVKGDDYYLDVLKKAYAWMQETQCMATGAYGPELEHLMPMDRIINSIYLRTDHTETQCNAWAAVKFCESLMNLTGNGVYGNWAESMIYNMILATIPMSPTGHVVYYSNYNINGALKQNRPIEWTCCAGTRPLVVTHIHRLIYFHDDKDLYVNLFTPSSVTWQRDGNTITVIQETDFPETDTIELSVSSALAEEFTIGFRVPEWLAGPMSVTVNGEETEGEIKDGWLMVAHQWGNDDRIKVVIPQDFWLSELRDNELRNKLGAIMRGPLTMAINTPNRTLFENIDTTWWSYTGKLSYNPDKDLLASIDLEHIKEEIVPGEERLEYYLKSDNSVRIKPFYKFSEYELYYMYLVRPNTNTSLEEISTSENNGWIVFPNPVEGNTIEIQNNSELYTGDKVQVQVFQSNGTLVIADNIGPNPKLDISSLSGGVYILRISEKNRASTIRFIKI